MGYGVGVLNWEEKKFVKFCLEMQARFQDQNIPTKRALSFL